MTTEPDIHARAIAAWRAGSMGRSILEAAGLLDTPLDHARLRLRQLAPDATAGEVLAALTAALPVVREHATRLPLIAHLVAGEVVATSYAAGGDPYVRGLLDEFKDLIANIEVLLPADVARQIRIESTCNRSGRHQSEAAFLDSMNHLLPMLAGSERGVKWEMHFRWFLAMRGRMREFYREDPEPDDPALAAEIGLLAFIDAVEAARVDEAAARRDALRLSELPTRFLLITRWYSGWHAAVAALLGGGDPRGPTFEALVGLVDDESMRDSLRDFISLPAGEVRLPGGPLETVVRGAASLNAMQPLRVSFARNDLALAQRLLVVRRESGCQHWCDDLMLARLRLREGDRAGAADACALAHRGAVLAVAEGRFELELRLAGELSRTDILRLGGRGLPSGEPAPTGTDDLDQRLVGPSLPAGQLRTTIRLVAASSLPVLITGETGAGKEVVARCLHERSPRRSRPFVAVNCTAINDTVLEAELFGHVRGAFSGAERDRSGLIASAGDGTLFLDEIGDASPRFQAALLRLLDSGEYRPVGASAARIAGCRIVAATNVDLQRAIEAGRFRRDLYHRLRRHEIALPPLDARRDDIVPLAVAFLNADRPAAPRTLAPELASYLRQRPWPGNVRELRNAMEDLIVRHPQRASFSLDHWLSGERGQTVVPARPAPDAVSPPSSALPPVASTFRQYERAVGLFASHRRLTRGEFAALLKVAPGTATVYLKRLRADGIVRKVEPSGAPVSHYFEWTGRSG